MAKTITSAFNTFRSNLEITGLQTTTVSKRQQAIRDHVAGELAVLDGFLSGSYARSTLIAPLKQADIDVFIVLDPKYYEANGQANLLDRVKHVLRKKYPNTPTISRNGQAVTITFTDFIVDVVPAFKRKGEGGGYLIANSAGGTWIPTDPKKHVEASAAANKGHNGDLVPLVKMIKQWNRASGAYFRSFHLEVLAWRMLQGGTISSFPSGTRYYFDKARSLMGKKLPDPAGYAPNVAYYLSTKAQIDEATSRLTTAYKRSLKAEEYASKNKIEDAIGEWGKVFGDCFPAYS